MQVSPISFGRAIKINANPEIAQTIANAANGEMNIIGFPTEEEKALLSFTKKIFNDTASPSGQAIVLTSSEDVYIFSGKEAQKTIELIEKTKKKIKADNDFVYMLPDRICREEQQRIYDGKHEALAKFAKSKISSFIEADTSLDVTLEKPSNKRKLEPIEAIKRIVFSSSKEKITYTKPTTLK